MLDPTENDDMNVLRVNRSREKMFVFDTAFGPFSTQVRNEMCTKKHFTIAISSRDGEEKNLGDKTAS